MVCSAAHPPAAPWQSERQMKFSSLALLASYAFCAAANAAQVEPVDWVLAATTTTTTTSRATTTAIGSRYSHARP